MRKTTKFMSMLLIFMITSTLAFAQQAGLSTSNVADPLPDKESLEQVLHGPTIEVPKATGGSRAMGDDCSNPIIIPSLPFVDVNATCGRGNNYSGAATCLGSYGGGEDIIYQFTLTETTDLQIFLQTTSTWTGLALSAFCPPNPCVAFATGSSGNKTLNISALAPGTYYIMIDTWPSPACIPSFTLTVQPPPPPPPGNTIADAIVIPAWPYSTSGNTSVGYTNNYDDVCPYSGSTAPDVVYAFTPATDMCIDIDLCGSAYDTKLYVYENAHTPGAPFACNDDYYGSGDPCGSWVSALFGLELTGGNTYYIVVDGYGTSAGAYELSVTECPVPYVIECPPGSVAEIEPCGENLNGGCNMPIPAFQSVNHGDIICGTLWAVGGTRDTDWYELVLTHPRHVILHADAEQTMLYGLINTDPENPTCPVTSFVANNFASPYAPSSLDLGVLDKGTYWIFAGLTVFDGFPCDVNYTLEFEVLIPPPVPVSNWALYLGILLMITFVVIRFRRMI
jgi:hypothetical protein